jgi:HK97 family phage major capsid protein
MAVNATKQAKERWQLGLKELEKRNNALTANPSDAALKTAFDEQMTAVDGLKSEYARLHEYESRMAAGKLDDHKSDPDYKTPEELAGMTDLEKRSDKINPLLNPDAKGYSLARALMARGEGKGLSGIELEVSQEMQKRNTSLGANGRDGALSIPLTLGVRLNNGARVAQAFGRMAGLTDLESRSLNATTTGTAGIPTILDSTIIEMLRNKVIMNQAGATILSGMTGVFDIPKQSAQPTVSIGGESVSASESAAQVASKVTFTPKTITGNSKVTRRFLLQAMASMDAENFLRMMILAQIALGVDLECITGPGTSNRGTGITIHGSVNSVAMGTNGALPTLAKFIEMETVVANANAEGDNMTYVFNAKGRGISKQTLKASAAGSTMLWENNTVNGRQALMSNQLPSNLTKGSASGICSAVLYGNFEHLIIALWSGVDVLVDPFTGGSEGATSIYCHQDFDLQLRYPEAFARILDLLTA